MTTTRAAALPTAPSRPRVRCAPSTSCRRVTSSAAPPRSGVERRRPAVDRRPRRRPRRLHRHARRHGARPVAAPGRAARAVPRRSAQGVEPRAAALGLLGRHQPVAPRRRAAVPPAGQDRARPVPQRARPRLGAAPRRVAVSGAAGSARDATPGGHRTGRSAQDRPELGEPGVGGTRREAPAVALGLPAATARVRVGVERTRAAEAVRAPGRRRDEQHGSSRIRGRRPTVTGDAMPPFV